MDTLQSEPITSVAPWRRSERNGYCRAATTGPRNGSVSSVIWSSIDRPVGLRVGERTERPEARQVVGVDDLDVGEVRPRVGPAVGPPGGLDGVERLADGPVAQRVEVRLEPEGVEADDGLRAATSGSMKSLPRLSVAWPWTSKYGSTIDGGLVLDDAVAHQLHAGGAEATDPTPARDARPARRSAPGPRSRSHHSAADDARRQLARLAEDPIGRLRLAASPTRPASS